MKIAVAYENGEVFQHFGHTEQFKIYEIDAGVIKNEQVISANGNGHSALVNFLAVNKVDTLICGGIGGGARNALVEAGINLYGGVLGSADEAVKKLIAGNLEFNPEVRCSHHDNEQGNEKHHCGEHGCGRHGCH